MTIELMAHQRRVREMARTRPKWAWFLAPGTGKTLSMLHCCIDAPLKTLVLAPKSILRAAWATDAAKVGLPITVIVSGSKAKRMIGSDWQLAVTNYECFRANAREFWRVGVQRIICDESSKLKSHTAQITKAVTWFADNVPSVWLLSGSPAPNHAAEYFSQIRCVGRGLSGPTYYGFENRYTVPIRKRIWAGGKEREITIAHNQTEEQKAALVELLNKCSLTLRREDCIELPPEQTIIIPVDLGDEASVYATCEDALRIEVEGESFDVNGSAALMKLRQITGGVVRVNNAPMVVGSAKLAALDDLLDSLGTEPVVIVAEFTATIDTIVGLLKKRGESVATIDGRSSSYSGQTVADFQAGKHRAVVIHPQAAGHGLTLTKSSYMIFFEVGFSWELHTQARARIQRIGQTRPVTYYVLCARDTVDFAAYRVVTRKGSASDEIRAMLAGKPGKIAVR